MSSMGLEAAAFAGRLLLAAIFLHEALSLIHISEPTRPY